MDATERLEISRLAHQVAEQHAPDHAPRRRTRLRSINWLTIAVIVMAVSALATLIGVGVLIADQPDRIIVPVEVPAELAPAPADGWSA